MISVSSSITKILPPQPFSASETVATGAFAREMNSPHFVAKLLLNRGIRDKEEARKFFLPLVGTAPTPEMCDLKKAVELLSEAREKKEKVFVHGDYDVDGTTAVSLVFSYFRNYFKKIDYYIPDRYKEGYGVSKRGIDFAAESGHRLIIALDCARLRYKSY